jgi:hypothetical protein
MYHARRLYKTTPKKQHRQIRCLTIPDVGMKNLKDKKGYNIGHPRHLPDFQHQHDREVPGGPVSIS